MNFGEILKRHRREVKQQREDANNVKADERNWLASVIGDGFSKIAEQFSSTAKELPVESNAPAIPSTITPTALDAAKQQASEQAFALGVQTGLAGHKSLADVAEAARLKRVEDQKTKAYYDYQNEWRADRLREDRARAEEEALEKAEEQQAALKVIGGSDVRIL